MDITTSTNELNKVYIMLCDDKSTGSTPRALDYLFKATPDGARLEVVNRALFDGLTFRATKRGIECYKTSTTYTYGFDAFMAIKDRLYYNDFDEFDQALLDQIDQCDFEF